ncbi:MAG TPA: heparinase II/III family protein [Candidatus Aminicenantes bacterium]|nr:heparinase II/III family protein [Candidatus Aminicenantes bacterium]HRY65105.1 heparinase II/III family protein [Candidatus Aminicenantes bacterium]HRZ72018.1 heparinase II/III family protein [Candidatus Aminicenantes bacterium]
MSPLPSRSRNRSLPPARRRFAGASIIALLGLFSPRPAPCGPAAAVKHPVFPITAPFRIPYYGLYVESVEDGIRQAAEVMSVPDGTLDAWNAPLAGFSNVGCPNCGGGIQFSSANLAWTPGKPDQIRCKHCGEVYPSARYPLTEATEIVSPAGTRQTYRYYPGKDGRPFYMDACLQNQRREWLLKNAYLLAGVYNETRRPEYARKAAVIIRRFAAIYPEMPVHGTSGPKEFCCFFDCPIVPAPPDGVMPVPRPSGESALGYKTPYPYHSVRMSTGHWFYNEFPTDLLGAYDQIAEVLDDPTRAAIEDYFRQIMNYVRTYPRYLGNMDGAVIEAAFLCGRIIGEPEFVHGGIIQTKMGMEVQFFADGSWKEGTPGYGQGVYEAILSNLRLVEGYSDPEGFVGAEDGVRYLNLDPRELVPRISLLGAALGGLVVPDGAPASVYDTAGRAGRVPLGPRPASSGPALLWACGHGLLGRGRGGDQVQARLQFMGHVGHFHYDRLSLELFAKDREMLPDIGYTHTWLRPYAGSTFAHNLVMIDESSQALDRSSSMGGKILAFAAGHPDVQFMSVRSDKAYAKASLYQRSVALVGVSPDKSYVVDIFEAAGGSRHDWLLHGDADLDGALETGLPLRPRAGSLLPPGSAFVKWDTENGTGSRDDQVKNSLGLVRNVRTARTDADWQATFRVKPDDGSALRLTMLGNRGTEVIFGEVPSIRRARRLENRRYVEDQALALDFWMPVIVARRTLEAGAPGTGGGLESSFTAVYEPYFQKPFLDRIGRDGRAVVVRSGRYEDIHLWGGGDRKYRMAGRYGFIRLENGKVKTAYLVDGTLLAYRDCVIELPPAPEGAVLEVDEKSLVVSGRLAEGDGDRIHLAFPTGEVYSVPIERIEPGEGRSTVILKEDPCFALDAGGRGGRFLAFPNKSFDAPVRYRIPRTASWPAGR